MNADELTAQLHHNLPITAAIGARVLHASSQAVEISAPFSANRNHHGSAFGGSLAMLGVLAGWVLVDVALQEEGLACKLVVQKSEIDFHAPLEGELRALARRSEEDWSRFIAMLKRKRRARIETLAEIYSGTALGVTHRGVYVAQL